MKQYLNTNHYYFLMIFSQNPFQKTTNYNPIKRTNLKKRAFYVLAD